MQQAKMQLLRELQRAAPLVYPQRNLKDSLQRAKFCIRALAFPTLTRRWFELLGSSAVALIAQRHPRLYSKLQRPYLHRCLSTRAQLEILQHHYRFCSENFSPAMTQAIYLKSGWMVGRAFLAEHGSISWWLTHDGSVEKEGDLTLSLVDDSVPRRLCLMSFSVTQWKKARRELFIGGLQSRRFAEDKERTITVTRAMHGLRPKALLLLGLQHLAQFFGVTSMRAVSNGQHIYQHFVKRKVLQADYDAFWTESAGCRDADGMFTLPIISKARDLTDIKATKRQMYRKRYVMIGELAAQFQARLEAAFPNTARAENKTQDRIGQVLPPAHQLV